MPNIARTNKRTGPPITASASRTKILLVRQPVKSVRHADQPDRTGLHLAVGVIVAVGTLAGAWLLGFLGFQLGFAELMRVPDLQAETGGGLATGARMIIGMPNVILQAGIDQPAWLMLGFAMIALPSAILGGVKPHTAGGPKPKAAMVALSYTGAITACMNALAIIAWTVSPLRMQWVRELPLLPDEAARWLFDLQIAAGLDVLAVIGGAVWVVVTMRLVIPRWLRGLCASACFFALAVVAVAMSMTNASVAQISGGRSVIFIDDGSVEPRLLIGSSPRQIATLTVQQTTPRLGRDATSTSSLVTVVELSDQPSHVTVVGRQNIVDFLTERLPRQP